MGGASTGVYDGTGSGEAGGLAVPGMGTGEDTIGLLTLGLLTLGLPPMPLGLPPMPPMPPVPVPVPVAAPVPSRSMPLRLGEAPGLCIGSTLGDVYTGVGLLP